MFAGDSPDTCYFIHDGDYADANNVLMWIQKGGLRGAPRVFVGESRGGVVIRARATVEADHVQLYNMTFDISGYPGKGSFNTITIKGADDVSVSHVTLTGDCQTGASGGHIEVEAANNVLVECCLIERFGRCDGDGHLDHGIYLASGTDIEIQNNLVRENSSRGIQLNTQAGEFGSLASVLIENNRIHANGHRPYEDGIAVNARESGTVTDLTIRHNLIYDNYYSGLRFVGSALSAVTVTRNTFYMNGVGSKVASPSEINLDDIGSGAETMVRTNIFQVAIELLNSCYDAGPRGFSVVDNLGFPDPGALPECVQEVGVLDPEFADALGADFHATAAAAAGYGAYP